MTKPYTRGQRSSVSSRSRVIYETHNNYCIRTTCRIKSMGLLLRHAIKKTRYWPTVHGLWLAYIPSASLISSIWYTSSASVIHAPAAVLIQFSLKT